MTPRAEAMVVWRCGVEGCEQVLGASAWPRTIHASCPDHPGAGLPLERIEVVPAAELDQALDALEFYGRGRLDHGDRARSLLDRLEKR